MAGAAFNLGDILATIKFNTDSLKQGAQDFQNVGAQTQSFGDKVQKGLNVAAVGLGVVGAGLTLYAKNASDYVTQLYSDSKSLGTTIGVSTTEASRLTAALGRMGISAQDASSMFGIFEKKIEASTSSNTDNQLATQKLQIQIDQTKQSIAATTAEIQKNGDSNGTLTLKLKDLNNTLATQQNQLNKSADSFAKLGISTVDAQGNQKGFEQILGEVADKFKAMPDGINKTQIAMDLFGRQGKDMIKVLNLGSQGIQDLETQADKLGLTLNADTIVKIQKLIQAQKDLKQQTDALKISVGTATAPYLTKFDTALNDILGKLINAPGPIHDATVGILAFGGPIASGAAAVLSFSSNLVTTVEAFKDFEVAAKAATVAQAAFDVVIDANPISLLIIALVALGGALIYVTTHMQQTGDFMASLSDKFTRLPMAIQLLVAAFAPFIALPLEIVGHWSAISGFFQGIVNYVTFAFQQWQINIQNISLAMAGFVMGVWNGLTGFFGGVVGAIAGAMSAISSWFWSIVSGAANAVNNVVAWVASLPGRILGAVGSLGGLLYSAGSAVMSGFLSGLTSGFESVKNFVGNIAGWIKAHKGPLPYDAQLLTPAGGAIMGGFLGGLQDKYKDVQSFIRGIAPSLTPAMSFAPSIAGMSAAAANPAMLGGPQITVDLRESSIVGTVPSDVAEQIGDTIINKLQKSVRI